jgi:hypothetical protein
MSQPPSAEVQHLVNEIAAMMLRMDADWLRGQRSTVETVQRKRAALLPKPPAALRLVHSANAPSTAGSAD